MLCETFLFLTPREYKIFPRKTGLVPVFTLGVKCFATLRGFLFCETMINFTSQITDFLRKNFQPSDLENATHKLTTSELLAMLFQVFPNDCIDDYELYDILQNLNYTPLNEKSNSENPLKFVWCLFEL